MVATVAEGVLVGHFAGGGEHPSEGIVLIGGNQCVVRITVDLQHVALEVLYEVVPLPLVGGVRVPDAEAHHGTVVAVDVPHAMAPLDAAGCALIDDLADHPSVQDAVFGVAAVGIGHPDPVSAGIVLVGSGLAVLGDALEPPALSPDHGGAIVIGGGISRVIVGDGVAVKSCQQILPVGVAIGVGMALSIFNRFAVVFGDLPGFQVPRRVIVILVPGVGGVGVDIVRGVNKLPQAVVSVGPVGGILDVFLLADVPGGVVGILVLGPGSAVILALIGGKPRAALCRIMQDFPHPMYVQ